MAHELRETRIARADYDALVGQPMHRTYALLQAKCPTCGANMNGAGFGFWGDQVRTLWRCVSDMRCRKLDATFALTTWLDPEVQP